jgi:hypothetical protein
MGLGKNGFRAFILCTLLSLFIYPVTYPVIAAGTDPTAPAIDPPKVDLEDAGDAAYRPLLRAAPPTTEWTLHKTADNSHPDGNEQQMLWLMNRARANPSVEGLWLATSDNAEVAGGRDYFDVDIQLLQEEFDQYAAKPPAAFDARLHAAAEAHSLDLIDRNAQDHDGQIEAITDNGFVYTSVRGNVFAYAESALNAHAAFNIDWGGSDGTGMQAGRGHRMAIMAIDGDYTNVGLAVVAQPEGSALAGDFVVTGNYCRANALQANHYNRFLVGTVWADTNANDTYDPGEGLGGITVQPDQGTYYAVTADSGGYALPILAAGTYTVTFSGAALDDSVTRSATLADQSLLLDLLTTDVAPPPPDDGGDTPPDTTGGDDGGDSSGGGCFIGALHPGLGR